MSYQKTVAIGLVLLSVLPLFMWACSKQQSETASSKARQIVDSNQRVETGTKQQSETASSKAPRVTLEIKPDGNILMDDKEVQPKDLASAMRQKAIAASTEIIEDKTVSLLEVLITAKRGDRYGRISGLITVCAVTSIRQLYFSHPDVNEGKEIKVWSRIVAEWNVEIALREFRIKMLWVDRKNPETKLYSSDDPQGTKGMLALKVKDNMLMKENRPDWESLNSALQLSVLRFEPIDKCEKLPVIIDPMAKVDFSDVLRCVLLCQKQDIGQLSFAWPEDHFYGK